MKKYLLSTSALASVALISSLASAEVELGGKVQFQLKSGDGHGGQALNVADADLFITGTTTTDGGLEVTGKFNFEHGNGAVDADDDVTGATTSDDIELLISGDFGTVKLHDADLYSGAAGALGIYAASVAAGTGGVDGDGSYLFTGVATDNGTIGGVEITPSHGAAPGITYISNDLSGLTFGVTMYFGEGEDSEDNDASATGQEIAVAYSADIGPGSLGLSYTSSEVTIESYGTAEGFDGDVSKEGTQSKSSYGLSYSAGAISFVYAIIDTDNPEVTVTGEDAAEGPEASSTHLGLAYSFGPGNVSYTTITTDYTQADGKEIAGSAETSAISFDYALGEGVTLIAESLDATDLDLATGKEEDGKSETILGVVVSF